MSASATTSVYSNFNTLLCLNSLMWNMKNHIHSHSHKIATEIVHNEIGEKSEELKEGIKSLSDI